MNNDTTPPRPTPKAIASARATQRLRADILSHAAARGWDPYKQPFKPSELGLTSSDYGSFSDYCSDTESSKWNESVVLRCVDTGPSGRPLRYLLLATGIPRHPEPIAPAIEASAQSRKEVPAKASNAPSDGPVRILWTSSDERSWREAIERYWSFVQAKNLDLEREFESPQEESVRHLNEEGWFLFLREKYFRWKYTAPNRYATTTRLLDWYREQNRLSELFRIKEELLRFNLADIRHGLQTATSIRGLGVAGASGLLTVLYPKEYGTVDQFVVKALQQVANPSWSGRLERMSPESLKVEDGCFLISIMREKAKELNRKFNSEAWTPRRIDMVLWATRTPE